MDILQIHIWQLPEKTSTIDKENEYAIIHDGFALKKVTMQRLYEYFNQDYKIDNIIKHFENIMESTDTEYEINYSQLELSLDEYQELINELTEKFKTNNINIRELEVESNGINNSIKELTESFENISYKHEILDSTFKNFTIIVSDIDTIIVNRYIEIVNLYDSIDKLKYKTTTIHNDFDEIKTKINTIENNISTDLDTKKEKLINEINSQYDKILELIDEYHHIKE